ncbi:hypothetical protein IE81DRAFT_329217 [Ceraceosorus guamensis]|uniref:Uncharacterized protein n=1 Tax=Ceraceosorus guamensis TaxID=1522189 RepID=A0A316W6X4_9BASI|nr:hypothetical protein IE81DRAFT_329217 [Ceraceosorus guamensis]PWN43833.1 hypothetical protein IE81DRAFT_329217 [Ceraceosorus guamensis]
MCRPLVLLLLHWLPGFIEGNLLPLVASMMITLSEEIKEANAGSVSSKDSAIAALTSEVIALRADLALLKKGSLRFHHHRSSCHASHNEVLVSISEKDSARKFAVQQQTAKPAPFFHFMQIKSNSFFAWASLTFKAASSWSTGFGGGAAVGGRGRSLSTGMLNKGRFALGLALFFGLSLQN